MHWRLLLAILVFASSLPAAAQSAGPAQEKGMRTTGAGAAPAGTPTGVPSNTFFVTWGDPREGAFQLGVPKEWQVTGGTVRAASTDVRHVVRAQSPDGQVRVFIDDPDLRPRQVPDTFMQQYGFREGQVIQGAWGGPVLLARYLTGTQFAQQYIRWKLCNEAQITQAADLRFATGEINASIQAIAARQASRAQASVGEAYFRCGGAVGYTMATTLWVAPASGVGAQLWVVYQLSGVVVNDPAQAGFAAYVLHTMLETFRMNSQWEGRQAQLTQDVTGAVTQMQQAMAQGIAQHAQRQASAASAGGLNHPNDGRLPTDLRKKWAGEDRLSQARQDATMGQKWMHTPWGENVRVDNSISNWWTDHSKNAVPGPSNGDPPPGCRGQCTKLEPGWQQ